MELAEYKGANVPIFALPPQSWEKTVCKGLIPKLLLMLSIDIKKNPERIAATELMIRESANRITPLEIEKAFLMYIKGQLPIEPRDNYLTPILFTKVITAYKEQKPPPPKELPPPMSEEDKELIIYTGLISCWDEWKRENIVPAGYMWVYEHLEELGVISFTNEEKLKAMDYAKSVLKSDYIKDGKRSLLDELEGEKSSPVIARAKRVLLGKFFNELNTEKKTIKDVL